MLERATAGRDAAGPSDRRVLLAEDDAANREVEMLMLESLGYDVDVVSGGAAAITAAAARDYAAILIDCNMAEVDGYAAASAIRESESPDAHVPIIGLSSYHDRDRALQAGMDDQLGKPFVLDALERALSSAAPEARPTAPAAPESVLDPVVVEQLRSLARAGSPELLERLQASFARDTPERLSALRAAVAAGDSEAVGFGVHTLRGSAANLGATEIVEMCRRIEDMPAAGAAELEPLLAELEQCAARAQAALTRLAATD